MSHKLKPIDLTNILLSPNAKFEWGTSSNRLCRFDEFVDDLNVKFAIVKWDTDPDVTNTSKVELLNMCAGIELREPIKEVLTEHPDILFDELVKLVRVKLMKGTPPLLLLANLMSNSQGIDESFEQYYNRVVEEAKSINWDAFSSENIKNVIIATTLASRSTNPFVKGHCMAVRDLSAIKLQDILNTAQEYEEKNPAPASFPSIGNTGFAPSSSTGVKCSRGLFGMPQRSQCGPPPSYPNQGQSLFGGGFGSGFSFGAPAGSGAPLNSGPTFDSTQNKSKGLFGSANPPSSSDQNGAPKGPSFEEARSGLFGGPTGNAGASATPAAPFGFSHNIFMSSKKGGTPKEGEASTSAPKPEAEAGDKPTVKRQRSEGAAENPN